MEKEAIADRLMEKAIVDRLMREMPKSFSIGNEGKRRYRIFTPFAQDDGGHFAIILKKRDGRWCLTDEGHTNFMSLGFGEMKGKESIIKETLENYGIEQELAEIFVLINVDNCVKSLYNFILGLIEIMEAMLIL